MFSPTEMWRRTTAVDKPGNTASAAATINLDKTPPKITATITPPRNAAGWSNSNVTVTFTAPMRSVGLIPVQRLFR